MSRETWQADCAAENFPEGSGPFLPPRLIDANRAEDLFRRSHEHDFGQFMASRTGAVESLAADLQGLVPQAHETVRAGMQAAIDQGYAPATALERLQPAFTQTAIQVVDQSILRDDVAAYEQHTDTMMIGTDAAEYYPDQMIVHEIGGHKVSGGTFKTSEDGNIIRVRRGFVNDEQSVITSGRHYGLDEAVVHHLALSYVHGEFETIDPDARTKRDTSYHGHRKLLAAFIMQSGGVIDLKAITRGSFEDSDESGAVTVDRRTMVTQARAAYGPGAYYKLNQLFEGMDFYSIPVQELIERIYSPEFDADGSIKHSGSIDIEDL